MHSTDSSRSLTSSPCESSISAFRLVNPLTISVSNESEDLQCTPIKHQEDSALSNNCSDSSSCNSSINIETNESIHKSGLLTYSTPIISNLTSFTQTKQIYNKPRVNFHSIDDIVYGGHSSQNDSGFASNSSTNNVTKSPVLCNTISSENKENSSPVNLTDNGKKVRTTFTDYQKNMLDVYFRKNPYPDPSETEELSQQLVLPENVIKVWFQNKRSRDKQRTFSHSHKSKNMYKNQVLKKEGVTSLNYVASSIYDSPLVANLKNISKFNSYTAAAAIAAFAHAAQNGNNFYNSQPAFYSN